MSDAASPPPRPNPPKISRSDAAFWRVTGAFFFGGFATFALLYSVQPLMPVFAREFAISPALASLSLSTSTGVLAVAMMGAGAVSDVFGRKRLMAVSLAATGLATMLAALAPDWPTLLGLRALAGLALAGLPAVAMAYLGDEMDGQAIGLAMGLYIAGSTLGGMAGRLVVAALSDHFGWRIAIAAVGSVGFAGAALIGAALPASRRISPRRPDFGGLVASLVGQFSDPGLRLLFVEGFLLLGSFVCAYNYIGFRLMAAPFSLSQTAIGFIFVLYLVGAVSSMVMGDLAGRYGRRRVMWIAIAIEAAGVAVTLPDNLVAVIAGVALITWGFFGAHSIASSWVGLRAHGARASASALYLFFYYVGSSLAGSAGGLFFARAGWPGVAGLLAAMTGAALVVALRLSKVPPPRHLIRT
ncbi:MAG: MFS transporter [Roseiarcus sp.]|jgi:YNFM family putative membrane transporter